MGLLKDMGLGWVFRARDEGAGKMQSDQRKGILGVVDAMDKLSSKVKGSKYAEIASRTGGYLSGMAQNINTLYNDMGTNLSGNMAATFAAASVMGGQAEASLGDLAKGMGNIGAQSASMSIRLNRDAGSIKDAFVAAARMGGKKVTADIFGSVEKFFKYTDQLGLGASDVSDNVNKMRGAFKMSDKQIRQSYQDVTTLGARFGRTKEFVEAFHGTINGMSDDYAGFIKRLSAEDAQKVVRSMGGLTGAFLSSGATVQDAAAASQAVLKTLSSEAVGFEQFMRGLSDSGDVPELTGEMSKVFGDLGVAMKQMKKDPLTFAAGMAKVGKALSVLRPDRLERLRAVLTKSSLGPAFTNLVLNSEAGRKSLAGLSEEFTKGKLESKIDAINDVVKKSKVGYTLQQQFDIMKDMFQNRLRKISQGPVKSWVKSMQTQFKLAGDEAAKLAADKGPIGALTRGLLKASSVGIGGLLAEIPGFGPKFIALGAGIEKVMGILPGLAAAFYVVGGAVKAVVAVGLTALKVLTSVAGLAAIAGGAAVAGLAQAGKKDAGAKYQEGSGFGSQMAQDMGASLIEAGQKSGKSFKSGWDKIMKGEFMAGLKDVGKGIGDFFTSIAEQYTEEGRQKLENKLIDTEHALAKAGVKVLSYVVDSGKFSLQQVEKMLTEAQEKGKITAEQLATGIEDAARKIKPTMVNLLKTFDNVGAGVNAMWEKVSLGGDEAAKATFRTFVTDLQGRMTTLATQISTGLLTQQEGTKRIQELSKIASEAYTQGVQASMTGNKAEVDKFVADMSGKLNGVSELASTTAKTVATKSAEAAKSASDSAKLAIDKAKLSEDQAISLINQVALKSPKIFKKNLETLRKAIGGWFDDVYARAKTFVEDEWGAAFTTAAKGVKDVFRQMWFDAARYTDAGAAAIAGRVNRLSDEMLQSFRKISTAEEQARLGTPVTGQGSPVTRAKDAVQAPQGQSVEEKSLRKLEEIHSVLGFIYKQGGMTIASGGGRASTVGVPSAVGSYENSSEYRAGAMTGKTAPFAIPRGGVAPGRR